MCWICFEYKNSTTSGGDRLNILACYKTKVSHISKNDKTSEKTRQPVYNRNQNRISFKKKYLHINSSILYIYFVLPKNIMIKFVVRREGAYTTISKWKGEEYLS